MDRGNESRFSSLKQERIRFAYERIKSLLNIYGEELVTKLKGLPVSLRLSGLSTLVAQLMAGKALERSILKVISDWLLKETPVNPFRGQFNDLLEACVKADMVSHGQACEETLALLEEAKLIAEALYGGQ